MQTVLLVIYLMVVLALIGVVLIQRSEGGGLGIGGGSGFMSARGTANALTRTTAILATLFFVLALGMGDAQQASKRKSDRHSGQDPVREPASNGVLDSLGRRQGHFWHACNGRPTVRLPPATQRRCGTGDEWRLRHRPPRRLHRPPRHLTPTSPACPTGQ